MCTNMKLAGSESKERLTFKSYLHRGGIALVLNLIAPASWYLLLCIRVYSRIAVKTFLFEEGWHGYT